MVDDDDADDRGNDGKRGLGPVFATPTHRERERDGDDEQEECGVAA